MGWLRYVFGIFLAAVGVSVAVAIIAWATGGPATKTIFFERMPVLVLFNFAVFSLCAVVAALVTAAGGKCRWAEQAMWGAGLAVIAMLPVTVIWPHVLATDGMMRWEAALSAAAVGATWASIDYLRRRSSPKP